MCKIFKIALLIGKIVILFCWFQRPHKLCGKYALLWNICMIWTLLIEILNLKTFYIQNQVRWSRSLAAALVHMSSCGQYLAINS